MEKPRVPARDIPTKEELLNRTLMRPQEAAAYLNVSPKTMRKLPITRVYVGNRTFRYRAEDLEAWVEVRCR